MTLPDASNSGGGTGSESPAAADELANTDAPEIETEEVENEDGAEPQPQDDDSEEIEHDGVKARVPKALKDAFLRHADYTRKTQELAEARRTFEEGQTSFQKQAAAQQAVFDLAGEVKAIERALKQFDTVDWQALYAQDPRQYEMTRIQRDQLRDAWTARAGELQSKVTEAQRASEAETATRKAKLSESLARDIKGYTPELATQMQKFGVATYGFSADEIAATTDARLHRLMHDAMIGRQLQEKAAKAAAAAKTAAAAEGNKPPAQVGNRAQAVKISASSPQSDKLSGKEWLRRREEELRKQRA